MARHLTVASAIDKNKIDSMNAWVVLAKIVVRDEFDQEVETLRVCKNNENITYQGEEYVAAEFDLDFESAANEEPQMKFSAQDPTGVIRSRMEDYNGGVGFGVTLMVVNSGNLAAEPEINEEFDVVSASAPQTTVSWVLGAENPLKYQFPYRRQYRDRCPWVFKGNRCQYVGSATSCDYTMNGPNGCRVKDNMIHFGGFPALRSAAV
jgi:phage-related protein